MGRLKELTHLIPCPVLSNNSAYVSCFYLCFADAETGSERLREFSNITHWKLAALGLGHRGV